MKTAVMCNVRTTYACWSSLPQGFDLAVRGGSVMGLFLCGCGNLVLFGLVHGGEQRPKLARVPLVKRWRSDTV